MHIALHALSTHVALSVVWIDTIGSFDARRAESVLNGKSDVQKVGPNP